MNMLLKLISLAGLSLTVVPSMLVFSQKISWDAHSTLMIIGTLMWFLTAPFWMKEDVS